MREMQLTKADQIIETVLSFLGIESKDENASISVYEPEELMKRIVEMI